MLKSVVLTLKSADLVLHGFDRAEGLHVVSDHFSELALLLLVPLSDETEIGGLETRRAARAWLR